MDQWLPKEFPCKRRPSYTFRYEHVSEDVYVICHDGIMFVATHEQVLAHLKTLTMGGSQ